MKAIILAAGQGKRMHPSKKPKCLMDYNGKTILSRLIKHLKKNGISEIIVIIGYKSEEVKKAINNKAKIILNSKYKKDINTHSMYLALNEIVKEPDDIVIFESDIIAENDFITYVTGTDFEGKSVWFTSGKFKTSGGIVQTDGKNNIIDIRVDAYKKKYANYKKLTGVMRIAKHQVNTFCDILKEEEKNQYYLLSWANNIKKLSSVIGNAKHYSFGTFNTLDEYEKVCNNTYDIQPIEKEVTLKNIKELFPIEKYDQDRIQYVKRSVIRNDKWIVPLRIEGTTNIIMDGHHSLELAKRMNLNKVPVIKFNYDDVHIWSLREEVNITKKEVIESAISGNIYPYKTVKHKFPNIKYKCSIKISELGGI